ncbi:hypothetical protein HN51_070236, partial [Arachis hypogaea]
SMENFFSGSFVPRRPLLCRGNEPGKCCPPNNLSTANGVTYRMLPIAERRGVPWMKEVGVFAFWGREQMDGGAGEGRRVKRQKSCNQFP